MGECVQMSQVKEGDEFQKRVNPAKELPTGNPKCVETGLPLTGDDLKKGSQNGLGIQ